LALGGFLVVTFAAFFSFAVAFALVAGGLRAGFEGGSFEASAGAVTPVVFGVATTAADCFTGAGLAALAGGSGAG